MFIKGAPVVFLCEIRIWCAVRTGLHCIWASDVAGLNQINIASIVLIHIRYQQTCPYSSGHCIGSSAHRYFSSVQCLIKPHIIQHCTHFKCLTHAWIRTPTYIIKCGMELFIHSKWFPMILNDYLSMLGLNSTHVSKTSAQSYSGSNNESNASWEPLFFSRHIYS